VACKFFHGESVAPWRLTFACRLCSCFPVCPPAPVDPSSASDSDAVRSPPAKKPLRPMFGMHPAVAVGRRPSRQPSPRAAEGAGVGLSDAPALPAPTSPAAVSPSAVSVSALRSFETDPTLSPRQRELQTKLNARAAELLRSWGGRSSVSLVPSKELRYACAVGQLHPPPTPHTHIRTYTCILAPISWHRGPPCSRPPPSLSLVV
jgi:hypothetical protein